jgi:hypothetical protein
MEKQTTLIAKAEDTMKVQAQLLGLLPELEKGKKFDVTIQEHRKKRSLNANNYSWHLQDKIAQVLNRKVDDVHTDMVLQYGVKEFYSIDERAFSSAVRIFDYYEIKGESILNGKKFIHIKGAIGTHLYDTKEMSRFIDGVVAEAQELGIETKTPDEIAQLKSLWEKENG